MEQIKQVIKITVVFIISLFLLTACSSFDNSQQVGQQPINDINKVLAEGAAHNKTLENQSLVKVPTNVANALLPSLQVQSKAQSGKQKHRFNISAKDMPAVNFFMGLVKGTKDNMVVDPSVQGAITMNLSNVTIEEALQAVQDNYGFQYEKTPYGYRILPRTLETRTFTVNYLDIKRTGQSNTTVSSGQVRNTLSGRASSSSPTAEISTTSSSAFWTDLKDTLTTIVGTSDGRQVVVNPDAGLVIVRAYPNEFKEVSKYLDSLQANMSRQVILEAKILEVELSSEYQAGIDWSILGLGQSHASSSLSSNLTAMTNSVFTLDMSFRQAFSAVMKMLSTQGNVQVLSSPRIAALNNQMAVIKVGQDEYFVTDVSSTTTSSSSTSTTAGVSLTPFFSGISLDVTPQIAANGDVILHIHPVISTVTEEQKTIPVGESSQTVPLALSKVRESDSVVRAKNGQIVILGGLMENEAKDYHGNIPGLSNAPLIGGMFKRQKQTLEKTELVILVRPIVTGPKELTHQIVKYGKAFKSVNRGFASGGKPKTFGAKGHPKW